jgi:hypothetical protein
MTTPSSGPISMNDINVETNLVTDMYYIFSSAQVGGLGGLMYHNLNMGISNAQTAKQAVYDPFSTGASGTNLNLSAWYNYSQTPNIILSWNITNNNTNNNVNVDIQIYNPATGTSTGFAGGNLSLNASGGNSTQTNFDTGIAANVTNFANGVYELSFNMSAMYIGPPPPPGTGVQNNTASASDTDGVGAGTTRVAVNPTGFSQFSPITGARFIYGNITGNGIYANKRTTFSMTFNN